MSMEAQKLRFVRCPKCLQLLVEYPSISVYQCGGCGAVLRAKNRVVSVTHTDSKPDEHNNFSCSLKGSPKDNKSICSDEQKINSSSAQHSEDAVEENIPSTTKNAKSCDTVNQEQTVASVESVTTTEHGSNEKFPVTDANIRHAGSMIKEAHDKGTEAGSSPMFSDKVENIGTSENTDLGKGYNRDRASDGNVGSDVAAVHSTAGEEPRAVNNHNTRCEVDSVTDQMLSASNTNVNCEELDKITNLNEETEANFSNALIQMEESSQGYEGLCVESHEDLVEELERSLSFSDDEESLLDVTDNNELNEALHFQIRSRRFSSGGKMNDASRSDPHGRLIEELERSFSDAEEVEEQHVVVVDKGIGERGSGNEHDKGPQSLVAEIAYPCEGNILSFDDGHLKSGQNELAAIGTKEKDRCLLEDESKINLVHESEHAMVTNNDITERIHSEHDVDPQSLDAESAILCEGTISSINGHLKSGQCFQENEPTADGNKEKEESHMDDDNVTNCVHADNIVVSIDGHLKSGQCFQENEPTADGNKEKEESYMDDDNMTNCVHADNAVVSIDGDLKSGQHFQENKPTADGNKEKEESHMDDDNVTNCVHADNTVVSIDGHLKSGQCFQENEPTANGNKEKEESYMDDDNMTNCVHADNAVVSIDGHLKSGQCFQENKPTADGNKEKEESHMDEDNVTNCVHADNAVVAGFSSLSSDGIHCKSPKFNEKKEERPYKYEVNQLYQGLSLDSQDFRSIQNFIESQMDGTSSSLSSGSPNQGDLASRTSNKFKRIDRLERLKKMDELRDQLNRLSSKKGLENRYRMKGLEYQPQLNSYYVDQHSQNVDADSIQSSCTLGSYYCNAKQPGYPPPNQFSPPHSCTHCHFGHVQTHIPHSYVAWEEFNSYYQPSYAGSTIIDHESLNSSYKEQKRVVRKHILRPVSGASPFTVCNSCFNLVQMPSDIYMSKSKMVKMQCGQCSKVLVLSFPAVYHMCANTSKEVAQKSNKHNVKPEVAAFHSAKWLTGDPVSINEEYGASYTRSFSTQAGSVLAASQSGKKVSDSALHILMGYDSASQLLHHSRVFDDGYESFESMVPVSSRVSRRKNT